MTAAPRSGLEKAALCGLFVAGSVVGLAGTDLVLPAIPRLPMALDTSPAAAQLVLAAYTGGVAGGLLLFGALGSRYGRRRIIASAMAAFAGLSFLAAEAPNAETLIVLRALQGAACAAPAVFAPGVIRALFSESGATRAFGVLGSLESLAPALAPLIGVWLLSLGGWTLPFHALGACAAVLAAAFFLFGRRVPDSTPPPSAAGYRRLVRSPVYLRYALSQALVLGGLLVFVFGAPQTIVRAMEGGLDDFVRLQMIGVAFFIFAANASGALGERFGVETVIWGGTALAALGAAGLFVYGLTNGRDTLVLAMLFVPLNCGLGLRGPPGFLRAVIAGEGDDDRASSLMILAIMGAAALGAAAFAPFVDAGLPALAGLTLAMELGALAMLAALPPLARAQAADAASVSSTKRSI